MADLLVSSTKTKHQVKSRLLLDVVVRESAAVLQLLSGKDQTLLIRRNSLLVLDLGLDVIDGVGWLHIKCDCFAGEGFYKDLNNILERGTEGMT